MGLIEKRKTLRDVRAESAMAAQMMLAEALVDLAANPDVQFAESVAGAMRGLAVAPAELDALSNLIGRLAHERARNEGGAS